MNDLSTITVHRNFGIREYENCNTIVHSDKVSKLKVPQSIRNEGALGVSVSFAQMIATWACCSSKTRCRNILTTLPSEGYDSHRQFVSRLHGLTAAYYAKWIVGKDEDKNLRSKLLSACAPRIKHMGRREYSKVSRGRMAELIFVNGAQHQFHSAVYLQNPKQADLMDPQRHGELIVSPSEMNAMVVNVLNELNLSRRDFDRLGPIIEDRGCPLGHLLHELFRNTAEHAYLDIYGRIPAKGLRCILFAVRSIEPDHLETKNLVSADHPDIDEYFDQLRRRTKYGIRKKVHILELSIFDTGPGFVDTISILGKYGEPGTDGEYVARCFCDHVSRKSGANSGLGLGRVLSHIKNLNGFVRFRTATTEVFYSSNIQESASMATPHVTESLPKVTGTVITIAIPLKL